MVVVVVLTTPHLAKPQFRSMFTHLQSSSLVYACANAFWHCGAKTGTPAKHIIMVSRRECGVGASLPSVETAGDLAGHPPFVTGLLSRVERWVLVWSSVRVLLLASICWKDHLGEMHWRWPNSGSYCIHCTHMHLSPEIRWHFTLPHSPSLDSCRTGRQAWLGTDSRKELSSGSTIHIQEVDDSCLCF